MKKTYRSLHIVWLLGVVVGLHIGYTQIVAAQVIADQERTKGFSEGFSLGLARFSDGDFGTGFSGRGFVEYAPFIHEIALRLSGGYFRFEDTVELGRSPFNSKKNLTFESFYVTGGVTYRFSRGKIVPFLTTNLGVYHSDKEEISSAPGILIEGVQLSPYNTVKLVEGYDFGFNVGGGIEYFMGGRTSLSVEALAHSIFGKIDSEIFDVAVMFRFFPEKR
jgi:hypothetical protein